MSQDEPVPISINSNNRLKINYQLYYEESNHQDPNNSSDEINLHYEHFRTETFANFVRLNSSKSSESFNNSSSDDEYRKFRREVYENFEAKIIKDTPDDEINLHKSKFRQIFRQKLSRRFSSTTIDLHSILKRFSCFKRVYGSAVDVNHNPTGNKNRHRLTYNNKKGKALTKSDIIHCQQFNDEDQNIIKNHPINIPKLCIEDQYPADPNNPEIHFEDCIRINKQEEKQQQQQQNYRRNYHGVHLSSSESSIAQSEIDGEQNTQPLIIPQSFSLSNFYVNPKLKQSKSFFDSDDDQLFEPNYCSISDCNFLDPSSTTVINTYSIYSVNSSDRVNQKMIANQNSSLNYFDTNSNASNSQNQPSYVNISRVNHGYVPYNRYTSEYRRDDSLLRGPIQDESKYSSLPLESSKGFLHKKIESLYGETFADDWNRTRVKKGQSFDKSSGVESSSVNQIESTLASSKLFQKIKSIDNSELDNKVITSNTDKDWWLREHQAQLNYQNDSKDGRSFLNKLQEQRTQIQNKIQQCEKWLTNSKDIPEDCVGKIRSAIGKANLLLDKKFQQFQKLCEDSINQGDKDEFKIQSDDLQGFWDMVMIQVNDINQTFEQLNKSKQNQWKLLEDQIDSIKTVSSPRIRCLGNNNRLHLNNMMHSNRSSNSDYSPIKYDKNNNNNNNNKTASPRDEERQRRLMEIKRRGKLMKTNEDNEEIRIFSPN